MRGVQGGGGSEAARATSARDDKADKRTDGTVQLGEPFVQEEMKNFSDIFTARSVNAHRPSLALPGVFVKAHTITRRALPALAIVGVTMAMSSTAKADVEGRDTSKGGEAPGADLRYGPSCRSRGTFTRSDTVNQGSTSPKTDVGQALKLPARQQKLIAAHIV